MNAVFTVLLVVAAVNLALALFVLWNKPKAEVNRVFALTAHSISGWTLTNALFQQTDSLRVAEFMAALSYFCAIILGASFLHFAWIFPLRSAVPNRGKGLLWGLAVLVGLSPFVPRLVIESVSIEGNRSIATNSGIYPIALFMLMTSVFSFGVLLRRHFSLHRVAREQSRYVLSGAALTAVVGLVCNLLLPLLGNYSLVWLGPVSSLFFVSSIVYAIVAKRLFDIKIIIKRTLVYSILLAAISGGFSAVESVVTDALRHLTNGDQHPLFASIVGAIVVSLGVGPVRHRLEEWVDHLLFGHHKKHSVHPEHSHPKHSRE